MKRANFTESPVIPYFAYFFPAKIRWIFALATSLDRQNKLQRLKQLIINSTNCAGEQ